MVIVDSDTAANSQHNEEAHLQALGCIVKIIEPDIVKSEHNSAVVRVNVDELQNTVLRLVGDSVERARLKTASQESRERSLIGLSELMREVVFKVLNKM